MRGYWGLVYGLLRQDKCGETFHEGTFDYEWQPCFLQGGKERADKALQRTNQLKADAETVGKRYPLQDQTTFGKAIH